MGHNIPKITYGALDTEVDFPYPPVQPNGNDPEQIDAIDHTNFSLSGARQTSLDRLEATRVLQFSHLSDTDIANLKTFFTTWAAYGKAFKYFEDKNDISYTTYELKPPMKFQPQRIASRGANVYANKVTLTFRRALGSSGSDVMLITIANNSDWANLNGLILDPTLSQTVRMFAELVRKTDTQEVVASGTIVAIYHTSTGTWDITPGGDFEGDATGVQFQMSGNQVQYKSDNLTGPNYVGTLKIKELILS